MIPGDLGMTLEKALKASPDLRTAYESDDEVKYLIDRLYVVVFHRHEYLD